MSIFATARVTVLVADFANVDQAGKLNVIGGFFALLGYDPQTRGSAPHHVAVVLDIPANFAGQEYALQLQMRNETRGEVVRFIAPSGQLEPLQIAQAQRVPPAPAALGAPVPSDHPIRMQTVLNLDAGVAKVEPGEKYAWKVSIDGQSKPGWEARFSVFGGGQAPPVLGGLAGPADIPDLTPPPPVQPSSDPDTPTR